MNSNLVVVQTAKWQRARGQVVPALVAASGRKRRCASSILRHTNRERQHARRLHGPVTS